MYCLELHTHYGASKSLDMNMQGFDKLPLLGILRGISLDEVEPITNASQEAGLKAIEITMNTSNATGLIKKMRSCAGNDISIGAGTVLSLTDL